MRTTLLSIAMLAATTLPTALAAQQVVAAHNTSLIHRVDSKYYKNINKDLNLVYPVASEKFESEAETIPVTIKIIYDENVFRWTTHFFANCGTGIIELNFFDEEKGGKYPLLEKTFELPAGIYSFSTEFKNKDTQYYHFVAAENVDITSCGTIEIDASTAINEITFYPLLPNGEKVKLPVGHRDEDYNFVVDIPGNAHHVCGDFTFCNPHRPGSVIVFDEFQRKENDPEEFFAKCYVNTLSDDYKIFIDCIISTFDEEDEESIFACSVLASTDQAATYSPNIENYTYLTWEYSKSSLPKDETGIDYSKISFENFIKGIASGGWAPEIYKTNFKQIMFAPYEYSSLADYTMGYHPYGHEYIVDYGDEEWGHFYVSNGTSMDPIFFENGKWISVPEDYLFKKDPDCPLDSRIYPNHPRFSFDINNTDIVYGNSVPVLNINSNWMHPDWENPEIIAVPALIECLGRLGENRQADQVAYKVTYNNETVAEGSVYSDFIGAWWYGGIHEDGVYEYELINNSILVDLTPGYNITKLHIDQTTGDYEAPNLRKMMTRNAEDFITDRFSTPEGAFVELCGGDFSWVEPEPYNGYYEYTKAAEVKVEWAPKDSNTWSELEVIEIPDGYFTGFGDLYRASLESVDRESESHWYDLRFTLTDKAGNSQQQTLSPAFRIDTVSGIGMVSIQNDSPVYYNLQGLRIDNPTQGIFIKRIGHNAEKVILK